MSETYNELLQWVMDAAADRKEQLEESQADETRGEENALRLEGHKLSPTSEESLERELEAGVSPERLNEIMAIRTMDLAKSNPEILRGIQRRVEYDEQSRRQAAASEQMRIDRENRARASAGLRDLVPGGSFLGNIENRVIAAVQDEKSRNEELAGIRNELAGQLRKWESSDEFKRLPKENRESFAKWGVGLLQSLYDAEKLRKDRPNDLKLWRESIRAWRRYGLEGDMALLGFARMVSGDRLGKEYYNVFQSMLNDPEFAMSARAAEGWKENGFNWNRFAVTATSGTLSMSESIAGSYVGAWIGGGLKAIPATGKAAAALSMTAKALPATGWILPMGIKTAGQSFGESMAYWQSRNDVSDRAKFWRSAGQGVQDGIIECLSEYSSYALGLGASKVAARFGKAQKPLEKMTMNAVKNTFWRKVGRGISGGVLSFREEFGEEMVADLAKDFFQGFWRSGDSELWKAWENGSTEVWLANRAMENGVGVLSTLLTGAAHGYRQYQWEGVQDWYVRPAEVLEDYNIRDNATGNMTVAAVRSLLEGDSRGLAVNLELLRAQGTEEAETGIKLVNQMQSQAKHFGLQGVMEDSLDQARGNSTIDVIEFQDGEKKGNGYLVIIGQGTEVSSVAFVETAEQAAFIQQMARSNAIGTVSPFLIQVPNTNAYAVKRENGGFAVYDANGNFQFDDTNPVARQLKAIETLAKFKDVKPMPHFYETFYLPAVKTRQAQAAQVSQTAQETQPGQPEAQASQPAETATQEGQAEPQITDADNATEDKPVQKPVQEAQAEHDAATMEPIERAIEAGKEGLREGLEAQIAELEEKQNTKGLSDEEKEELARLKDALEDLNNPRSIEELEEEEEQQTPAEQPKPAEEKPAEQPKPAEEKPAEEPKPAESSNSQKGPIDFVDLQLAHIQRVSKAPSDVQWTEKKYKSDNFWSNVRLGMTGNDAYFKMTGQGAKTLFFRISNFRDHTIQQIEQELIEWENARSEELGVGSETYPLGRAFDEALWDLADYGMEVGMAKRVTRPMLPTNPNETDSKPAEEKPAERPKPAEEKPAEQPKPAEESKPYDDIKPSEAGERLERSNDIVGRLIEGSLKSVTIIYSDGTVEGTARYKNIDGEDGVEWIDDNGNGFRQTLMGRFHHILIQVMKEGANIIEEPAEQSKPEETKPAVVPKPSEETKPAEEKPEAQPKPAEEKPAEEDTSEGGNLLEEQERQEAEKIKNLRSDVVQRFIDLVEDMNSSAAVKRGVLNRLARENDISVKTAEEIAEALVVAKVRLIAANRKMNIDQKWVEVKRVYEHQPNFSTRTSTSLINQAYSTPVTISFMGGIRVGAERGNIVYEPTAGTGSLVAVAQARDADVYANELNPVRVAILNRFGGIYESVTQGDALATKNDAPVDIVMTNPPFANAKPMKFGDFTLSKLDHQIAAHALNDLKVDGRALVIVGANTRSDGAPTYADHVFMNFLYTNFNVVDNYIIDGSLYRKQGQSNPIRLLTVNGRRKASDGMVESPTEIRTLKTFDEIFEALKEELPHGQSRSAEGLSDYVYREGREGALPSVNDGRNGTTASDGGSVSEGGGESLQPGGTGGDGGASGRAVGDSETSGNNGVRGTGRGGVRGDNGNLGDTSHDTSGVQGDGTGVVQEPQSEGTDGGRGLGTVPARPGEQGNEGRPSDGVGADSGVEIAPANTIKIGHKVGEKNNAYLSASKSNAIGTVVNNNLAEATAVALNDLVDEVGDVDEYVRKELGYDRKEELFNGLAAEQIDGVALAIRQLSQNNGFLIGDVTGLGKGRQAAAIIRWAQQHNKLPIFFTENAPLFNSMYYDGKDIGSDFKPLLMGDANEGKIKAREGENALFAPPSSTKAMGAALKSVADGTGDYDCVFTCYSQFGKEEDNSAKRQEFLNIVRKRDVVFILDEAHNAAGDSNRGRIIQSLIAGKPVLYSSATAIKRADNLAVYYRLKAFGGQQNEDFVDILKDGGPVLMQLFTQKLVADGSYIRREKDLSDVKYEMKTVTPSNFEKIKSDADRLSVAFRKILDFTEIVKMAVQARNKYARANHSSSHLAYNGFGSVLHNFVSQYLLAAKVDSVVDEAIASMKRGEKVVIALTNTMESVINDYAEALEMSSGDLVTKSFSDVLRRYVCGPKGDGRSAMLRAHERLGTGQGSTLVQLTPGELGLQDEYQALVDTLDDVLDDVDFALSPIDMIEAKIRKAGYEVDEITKREHVINYDVDKGTATLEKRAIPPRNEVITRFNTDVVNCVILNAAGSTGISLHDKEWFPGQAPRPRRMLIVQPSLDINTVIQTLGRINRTGQRTTPFFSFLATPLTAEVRPNFVLAKKMRSLGAATAGDQKSDVDLGVDFINDYGDDVAAEWLFQNDDLRKIMGLEEQREINGEIVGETGLMAKLTGRTVLFDDKTQKAIFDDLGEAYNEKIDELKRLGKYTLDVNEYDGWNAVLKSSEKITDDVEVRLLEVDDKIDIPSSQKVMSDFASGIGTTREEVAGKVNGIITEMRRMIAEDMPKAYENGEGDEAMPRRQKIEYDHVNDFVRMVRDFLSTDSGELKPRLLQMRIGDEVMPVALVGIKAKLVNKRHPGNLGQIKLKFAVAGTLQRITVTASKIKVNDSWRDLKTEFEVKTAWKDIDTAFTGERKTVRGERYVFTGDLIRGYSMSGDGAQIVAKYKYKDGREEIGVIQSKNWKVSSMRHDPRLDLNDADSVKSFFDAGDSRQSVYSQDGVLEIRRWGDDGYLLIVPAAAREGGRRYSADEEIAAITGNWSRDRRGKSQVMTVGINSGQFDRLLSLLFERGITFRKPNSAAQSGNSYRVDNSTVDNGETFKVNKSSLTVDAVKRLSDRLGFHGIVVVNGDEGLPYTIREDVYSDRVNGYLQGAWKGIYRDGVCYINAPAHYNEHDAVVSILHEAVVHKGLRCLFPSDNELNAFLDKCYSSLMQIKYAADSKIGEGLERYKAIEEAIGDFADNEQYKPMYKKILDWIRTAISKVLRAVGVTKGIPDDVELRDILKQAAVAARERTPYDGNSPGATLYSSSSEVERRFPGWRANMTTTKGGHKTQIAGTVATYGKIGEHLLAEGFNGTILDASSGKGIGTAALREMGFEVDDVEPYAERGYNPRYSSYEDVNQQYDLVISNAVLNVVEDDVRDKLLEQMKGLVAPGGRLFINVRPARDIETQIKNKVELDSPSEVMVLDNSGKPQSYQKGFTAAELKEYVASKLGEGFTVVQATAGNIGTTGGVAVVATRDGKSPINAQRFGKVYYRMSLSAKRQAALDVLSDWFNGAKDLAARLLPWGDSRGGVRPFVNRALFAAKGELAAGQEEVRVVMKEMNDARKAIKKEAWANDVEEDLDKLLRDQIGAGAVRNASDPRVQRLISSVMRGRKLLDGLSLRIASEMGDILPLSTGLAIQNNVGKYTIRAYEKFINPNYKPTQEVVDQAKAAVETEFLNRFAAVVAHVNSTNYTQAAKRQRMLDYLVTRNDNLLVGQSKQFERKARIFVTLIDRTMAMCNDAIVAVANGNDLAFGINAQTLANTVQGTVDMLLSKDVEEGGYVGDKSSARWKIARDSFLHRKNLPDWLRELYGEITDYGASVALTANRSVRVLTMNNMYRELLDYNNGLPVEAIDRIFYDAPYTDKNKKCDVRMDGFGFGVLRGMYTDRNTYKMLNSYGSEKNLPRFIRKAIGVMRMSKTVLNIPTHARNVLGNGIFVLCDGEALRNPKSYLQAFTHGVKVLTNDGELAERQRLMRLGVIGSGAHAEEYSRTMNEVFSNSIGNALYMNGIFDVLRKGAQVAETCYAFEDNAFRVAAFYAKTARGMSDAKAAEEVSDLYPTYDRAPVLVDVMRRNDPLAPDFMSFRFETLRCTINSVKKAIEDAKHGDFWRVAGVVASLGAALPFVGNMLGALCGMLSPDDDDKDKLSLKELNALRELLPAFRQNNLVWPWKDGNTIRYVDVEYIYPNEWMSLICSLGFSNRPIKDRMEDFGEYCIENYAIGGMLPQAMAEQYTNTTNSGRRITNTYDGFFNAAGKRIGRLATYFLPSMMNYAARSVSLLFSGDDKVVNPDGEVLTWKGEALKMVQPLRVYQLDTEAAYKRKMRRLSMDVRETRWKASAVVRRWQRGETTREDAQKAIEAARETLNKSGLLDAIYRADAAGQTFGLPISHRERLLHEAGFTIEDTRRILSKMPLEYTIPK